MDAEEVLTVDPRPSEAAVPSGCPKCAEPWGAVPPVEPSFLPGAQVRRCNRCGTRATAGAGEPRLLFTCEACALPFLHEEGDDGPEESSCSSCRSTEAPTRAPEAQVVHAMETEIRTTLAEAWGFVASESLSRYLEGIVGQLVRGIDGAPPRCRVVLIDEPQHRILGLPSGLLLMSTGLLGFLEDEAELVFVLARELNHVASGKSAARVVRASLGALAQDEQARPDTAWTEAMLDVVRLGYGRRSELDADGAALRAMIALRYEPNSALNLLRRLKLAVSMGRAEVSEVAVAHPPPGYRARKLERILYGRIGRAAAVQRVNREVFRRVAGPAALDGQLEPTELGADEPPVDEAAGRGKRPGAVPIVVAAVALTVLALVLGLLLLG